MSTAPPGFREALADRYRLGPELGSGVAATVYRAHDLKHDRPVAIKVLRPDLTAGLAGERFLREIAIAAQLQHPHILPLLDSGAAAGSLYFVMPFAEGETLRARLKRTGRLGAPEAARILADVADALMYAHERGVVHRDIKPDNIMITGRHAVVMDFGVAKALRAAAGQAADLTVGVALGTPTYMAPEQALASPEVDHRADLYALGVVGYELLTGRPPFVGASPQDVLTAHVALTPEPIDAVSPDVPAPLARLVMTCLAKRPEDRWGRAAELVERLDPLVTPSGGITPASTPPRSRMDRWFPWAGSAVGVAGALVAVWLAATRARPVVPAVPDQLTFLGTPIEAAISPDGQFLAFVGRAADHQQLFVQDLTGSSPVSVAEGLDIADVGWSAAGGEVGYRQRSASGWTVWAVPRLGGSPRRILDGSGIRSPDGARVVLHRSASPEVPVVTLASGDTTLITRSDGYQWVSGMAWSPGSERLAMALSSPETGRTGLAVLGLDGSERVVVRDSLGITGPAWAPDGKALYFVRSESGRVADVVRVPLDRDDGPAGPPELVAAGLSIVSDSRRSPTLATLSLARDGRMVLIQTRLSSNLARLDLRTAGPRRLEPLTMGTAQYLSPRLSPGGDRLAVFKALARGTIVGITGTEADTFEEVASIIEPGDVSWSRDGSTLAFSGAWRDYGSMVGVYDPATGRLRRLGRNRVSAGIDWLGDRLVVQQPGNRALGVLDPATDSIAPLVDSESGTMYFHPRVSPDGRWIACLVNRFGVASLWIYSLETNRWQVARSSRRWPIGWSQDGTLFTGDNEGPNGSYRLIAIPPDGRPERLLATFPPDFTVEDVSLDGQLLIVNQTMRQSDVWVLTPPPR